MRHFDRDFAPTNRLRTEGTNHLLSAGQAVGVRRWRNRVARTLTNWLRLAARVPGVSFRPVEVNGGPGALFLHGQEQLIGVFALDIAGGQITRINSIVNPDKLRHLGPIADYRSLLKSAR